MVAKLAGAVGTLRHSTGPTIPRRQPAQVTPLIDASRFETDKKKYETQVQSYINMAFDEVPRIPLAQPNMDVAMQKSIKGYTYWFHLQPDYRDLEKA